MIVGFVGAAYKITHRSDRAIGNHANVGGQTDRSDVTRAASDACFNFAVCSEAKRAETGNLRCFYFIQVMIATHQQHEHVIFVHQRKRFYRARQGQAEHLRNLLAGCFSRRRCFLHFCGRLLARLFGCSCFGKFNIRRVIRVRAKGDRIFSRIRKDVKLMRARSADGARIRGNRAIAQAKAREDASICVVHILVLAFQVVEVGVKRICVLHDKFARAHDTKARPYFVPEFGLNLVQIQRQLPVGANVLSRNIGDDFFVGWPKTEVAFMPVPDLEHLRTEYIPSATFLPEFRGLNCRQE